jgi:hypothetical protein
MFERRDTPRLQHSRGRPEVTPIPFAYARRMSESPELKGLGRLIAAPAPKSWSEVVFVCAKCMKRQDRRDVRKELKRALKEAGRRDVRVIASGCFDLCPKRGVTIARGRDLGVRPGLHVLDNGDDAELAVRLMLES